MPEDLKQLEGFYFISYKPGGKKPEWNGKISRAFPDNQLLLVDVYEWLTGALLYSTLVPIGRLVAHNWKLFENKDPFLKVAQEEFKKMQSEPKVGEKRG
jgi:hypothetical protein